MPHRSAIFVASSLLVGAGGIGVGIYGIAQTHDLQGVLAGRCESAQVTRTARIANLHGDLVYLRASRAFFAEQIRRVADPDSGLSPSARRSIVTNYRHWDHAAAVNIRKKQHAIDNDVLRPCDELRASG